MIKTDAELDEKLDQLCRLYRAVRQDYAHLDITVANAVKRVKFGGRLTTSISIIIAEVEAYTRAGEIRILQAKVQDKHREGNNG